MTKSTHGLTAEDQGSTPSPVLINQVWNYLS